MPRASRSSLKPTMAWRGSGCGGGAAAGASLTRRAICEGSRNGRPVEVLDVGAIEQPAITSGIDPFVSCAQPAGHRELGRRPQARVPSTSRLRAPARTRSARRAGCDSPTRSAARGVTPARPRTMRPDLVDGSRQSRKRNGDALAAAYPASADFDGRHQGNRGQEEGQKEPHRARRHGRCARSPSARPLRGSARRRGEDVRGAHQKKK